MSSPPPAHPARPGGEIGPILVVGFALAMLLPITVTPFLGDDIFNSHINGAMGYGRVPFWAFIAGLNAAWIRNGRFFPGALLESYGLFHVMPSLLAYKTFQFAITLANVGTFFVLVRALGSPRATALLATLVLLCTFQVRQYHDGLLGFSGNIEFIMELTMLSLLGLIASIRRRHIWPLIASLAMYAIGLLTYEATYLMWLAFFIVLLDLQPWPRALRSIAPYAALSAVVIGVQLFVKAHASAAADADYTLRLNAASLAVTFAKQAIAAIPLTYVVIDPSALFAHGAAILGDVPLWMSAAMFAVVVVAAWTATGGSDAIDRRPIRSLAAVGLILWLTPALLVASSARYQRELVFGLGHVPVYIEYFGVTLIALALYSAAVVRWGAPRRWARAAIALGLGFVALTTYASNAVVIGQSQSDKLGLLNMDAAIDGGLLRSVPQSADLYVDASIAPNRYLDESDGDSKHYFFYRDAKYFYFDRAQKRVAVHGIGSLPLAAHCRRECPVAPASYELLNVPVGERAGYAVLGHLTAVATLRDEVRSFATDVTVFVRGVTPGLPLAVRYIRHGCGRDKAVIQPLPIDKTNSIVMTTFTARCGSIDMSALAVRLLPPPRHAVRTASGMNSAATRRNARRHED